MFVVCNDDSIVVLVTFPQRFISTTPVLFLAATLTALGLCWATEIWLDKPSLMVTLRKDGFRKVREGLTTVEEVIQITGESMVVEPEIKEVAALV